jgi:hypothetical protein
MRFYGTSYKDVLQLPIKVFINLFETISIVRAEENINDVRRNATLLGGGEEYMKWCMDTLEEGIRIEKDDGFDKQAFDNMKTLFSK